MNKWIARLGCVGFLMSAVLPGVAQSGSSSSVPKAGMSADVPCGQNATCIVRMDSPVQAVASHQAWEYGVLAQGGVGMTENRDSFRFLLAGVHLGKVLTNNSGHHLWSGQFEYAVETFPFWQSYTPSFLRANCTATPAPGEMQVAIGLYCGPSYRTGGTYSGVSVTPIILRWNFTHGKRFMPWAQGAGGLLWTNHKYPAFGSPVLSLSQDGPATEASVWNFTPQGGVGFHYFLKPKRSIDFSANGIHISSASLGDKNQGVKASVQFSLGYTWWK